MFGSATPRSQLPLDVREPKGAALHGPCAHSPARAGAARVLAPRPTAASLTLFPARPHSRDYPGFLVAFLRQPSFLNHFVHSRHNKSSVQSLWQSGCALVSLALRLEYVLCFQTFSSLALKLSVSCSVDSSQSLFATRTSAHPARFLLLNVPRKPYRQATGPLNPTLSSSEFAVLSGLEVVQHFCCRRHARFLWSLWSAISYDIVQRILPPSFIALRGQNGKVLTAID